MDKFEKWKNELEKELSRSLCDDEIKEIFTSNDKEEVSSNIELIIDKIDNNVSNEIAENALKNCGKSCIGDSMNNAIEKIKKCKDDYDIDFCIDFLNKCGVADGSLKRNGDLIEAVYKECYCPMLESRRGTLSKTFCSCSCGWFEQLFNSILDRKTYVEVTESIASGGEQCRFIIHI